jgi:hypothetical protein
MIGAWKVCARCPKIVRVGQTCCDACAKHLDKARGGPAAHGYDRRHNKERARWKRILDRKPWPCARCGKLILVGDPWDLGHTDDRTAHQGPEHPACNRAAGARTANARRATRD